MSHDQTPLRPRLTRRSLMLGGAAAAGSLAALAAPGREGWNGAAAQTPLPPSCPAGAVCQRLVATDGFISLPGRRDDPLYIFGFRGVEPNEIFADAGELIRKYKGRVQLPSPILGVDEGMDYYLTMTNLGLVVRPDLDDSHTVHWHGFRNPIALFDGVPETSISVPVGRDFPYFYRPRDPGTYMYHCHFEDVEHVQMGMHGIVFIRPGQSGRIGGFRKFAYNDGDGSTGYDREFTLMLNEIDPRPHDLLRDVQEFVWSDYRATYWTINGRAYPDTLEPNNPGGELEFQPISARIEVNEGDRVLLRFANLGYEQHAMQLPGVTMTVVGHDATLLRNPTIPPFPPDAVDLSYDTGVLYIGPGEARDVLFTAPSHGGGGRFDTYQLRNRSLQKLRNGDAPGLGGMVTEVRVYRSGTLPNQAAPNQIFDV